MTMTLKFERIEAGMYRINSGSTMVGFIKKQSSAKWIMYKCSNLSVLGNPVAVSKTLKEIKVEAETMLADVQVADKQLVIDENSNKLDNLIKEVQNTPDKTELMKEMLERGNVMEWNTYDETGEKVEDVNVYDDFTSSEDDPAFSKFLTEDQLAYL